MTWSVRHQRLCLWLTAAVLLAAASAVIVIGIVTPVEVTATTTSTPRSQTLKAVANQDRLQLTAFQPLWSLDLQRPLFDAPKVVAAPPPPPPPPPLKLRLLGTILEPGNAQAIVQTADNRIEFVRSGQTIDNATINVINDNQIEVTYHNQPLTLTTPAPATGSAPGSIPGS